MCLNFWIPKDFHLGHIEIFFFLDVQILNHIRVPVPIRFGRPFLQAYIYV